MTYSTFGVLVSRPGVEISPFTASLEAREEIFFVPGAFDSSLHPTETGVADTGFLAFMERYGRRDVRRLLPRRQETMFRDYLEYLNCLSPALHTVLLRPCDALGLIAGRHRSPLASPCSLSASRATSSASCRSREPTLSVPPLTRAA